MQASSADLIQKLRVLSLYKNLYRQVKISQPPTNQIGFESIRDVLRNEFRQNIVSDSRYCLKKNEMYFLGNAYFTYLESTKQTLDLYARYCRGERSIEDSARIVGLKLPKLYQEENKKE
jgi:hypothetical protein